MTDPDALRTALRRDGRANRAGVSSGAEHGKHTVPPVAHLRKVRRRLELLREAEAGIKYLDEARAKDAGPNRYFAERYDRAIADAERVVDALIEAKEQGWLLRRPDAPALPPEEPEGGYTLEDECDRYGLPHDLSALLRHIYRNNAATYGAQRSNNEALRERLDEAEARRDRLERAVRYELEQGAARRDVRRGARLRDALP